MSSDNDELSKTWQNIPKLPATPLAHRRRLAPSAGVHVSPFCLGALSIGDQWSRLLGDMNRESSFKLLNAFFDAGGNFIDTANGYQDETSERFIGEWAEERGIRDQLFIATKYTTHYKRRDLSVKDGTFYVGNSRKSLHLSVEDSLKKLRTSYIDLLYVHWWDYATPVEEVMDSLHNLVQQGKVLYLGISGTPAFVVSRANQYARDHGKTPFVIYQGPWNVMQHDIERDIIPMCRMEGMAIAPWNVFAGGKLRTDAEEEERKRTGEHGRTIGHPDWLRNENETRMSRVLEKVAKDVGAKSIYTVAIAYVMQKVPYVFPILGGRKVEHLYSNIEALEVVLEEEHIAEIEEVFPFDAGFPYTLWGNGTSYSYVFDSVAQFDVWPLPQPIRPDLPLCHNCNSSWYSKPILLATETSLVPHLNDYGSRYEFMILQTGG